MDQPKMNPWVSFCMSTYKRPVLLNDALLTIQKQLFPDFEVIVSDNDPDESAKKVVENIADSRFRYFSNQGNLGMMKSFNKSIERASGKYIVMITDDDPVIDIFLQEIKALADKYPGFGIYAGFLRPEETPGSITEIRADNFVQEILSPHRTSNILWSSCIIEKEVAIQIGKIPDFGSPHLADHALVAMAGSIKGGVVINKMFSTLSSHSDNFSKKHLETYYVGCKGFYESQVKYFADHKKFDEIKKVILKHLGHWFIVNYYSLKRYYTRVKPDAALMIEIEASAKEILQLPFMKRFKLRYNLKAIIFRIKTLGK